MFLHFISQPIQKFPICHNSSKNSSGDLFSSYSTKLVLFRKPSGSRVTWLLLSFWHLFNKDTGHWIIACIGVSILLASSALSNPESHSHFSLVNVITVTFNMAVTKKIAVFSGSYVECTINGSRRAALGAIEGEIPTATAVVTIANPEVTSKENMQGSVCEILHKFAVLRR